MEVRKENYFEELYNINVQEKVEQKNGLSYLAWAYAWAEVKKIHPTANYIIYERESEYGPINYFTDGRTCWVKTSVIINDIEHIDELPIMDNRNKSIFLENVTSFDVNKSIQRSLTKAAARHGLGLYIYAGEDLPESEIEYITEEQIQKFKELNIDEKDAIAYCKVNSIEKILKVTAEAMIKRKENALNKKKKEE